jgi:hypothetical protein
MQMARQHKSWRSGPTVLLDLNNAIKGFYITVSVAVLVFCAYLDPVVNLSFYSLYRNAVPGESSLHIRCRSVAARSRDFEMDRLPEQRAHSK